MLLSTNPFVVENLAGDRALSRNPKLRGIKEALDLMERVVCANKLLASVYGKAADRFICNSFNLEDFDPCDQEASRYMGVIVYFSFQPLYDFLRSKTVEKKTQKLLNHALKIVHREVETFRGRLFTAVPGSYFAVWRYQDEIGSIHDNPPSIDHPDLKRFFKKKMSAKAELAFSAVFTAMLRIKVFVREYMYYKQAKFNFRAENLLSFVVHAGEGFEGIIKTDSRVDMVTFGSDVKIARLLAESTQQLKCDLLVTEFVHELLSLEVVPAHPD